MVMRGRPVTYLGVVVATTPEELDSETPVVVRDPDGRFHLRKLPPGPHRIAIVGASFERLTLPPAQLSPGGVLDLGDITQARGTEMYMPLWLRMWAATGASALNIKLVTK